MGTSKDTKYISPNLVVYEIKASAVICQSGGTTDYYNGGDTSSWF